MNRVLSLLLFLIAALPALGQGVRIDPLPVTTISGQPLPGMNFPVVLAIPNANIFICNYPASGNPCTNLANTYLDATLSSQCPAGSQVVLNGQNTCQSTADGSGNFGFWVAPGNYVYQMILQSGQAYGPFFISAGGSSSSGGVASINGITGAFTFTGSVTCSATISPHCVFSGGGGGGVNPGSFNHGAYYVDATNVGSDIGLMFSTPTAISTDQLSYNGGGGVNIDTDPYGGVINLTVVNGVQNNTPAQINFSTSLSTPNSSTNPGQITISTIDTDNVGGRGLDNAANIVISATENSGGTANNDANINILASDTSFSNNNANINISATNTRGSNGGNVTISGSGPGGGNVNLFADPTFGAVYIKGEFLRSDAPNLLIDQNGSLTANLFIRSKGGFSADNLIPGNCLMADSGKNIVTTSTPCSSGGGGSIGGSGTGLRLPMFTGSGASVTLGDSHIDDGLSNAAMITATEPVVVADGTGTGGAALGQEGTAVGGTAGVDNLWASQAFHRWTMNNNNVSNLVVVGTTTTPATGGNCAKFAANGYDVIDAGAGCNTAGSSFTPTTTIDSGAGTGGSLSVSLVAGANDDQGWLNITTGNTPAASSGVVTINYGGTYATIRKCFVEASNTATSALSGTAKLWVPQSTATTTHFVINAGATALTANTTYQVYYGCGL